MDVSVQYCCEGRIGKERVCMCMRVCVCIQYKFCSYKHFTVCRVYLHGCMVLQHSTLSSCAAIFLCCTKREDTSGLRLHKKRGKIALLLRSDKRKGREEKKRGEKERRKERRKEALQQPVARCEGQCISITSAMLPQGTGALSFLGTSKVHAHLLEHETSVGHPGKHLSSGRLLIHPILTKSLS